MTNQLCRSRGKESRDLSIMEPRFIFGMGEAAHFIFDIQVNISECEYQKKARRFVERFIMNLISKALRWHVLKE